MTTIAPSTPAPARRKKVFDFGGFLRRRWLLILILGAGMTAALEPIFLLSVKPQFVAGGQLLVDASKEQTLTGREREAVPGNVGDFAHTLVSRIANPDILATALRTLPVTNWPSFLDPSLPLEKNAIKLMKSMTVKDAPRSYLITISATADEGRGLGDALNAVMATFLDRLDTEQEQRNAQRLEYLHEERRHIEERIAAERKRLLDLAATVPDKAFLHENYSVHLTKVEQLQKLYWDAEAERASKHGQLLKAIADQQEIGKLSLQPYADERVADNFGINRIEQWTYEQLQTLRANIDGLTSNNLDRVYVEQRMSAMNGYLDKCKKDVNETTIRVLLQKRDYDLRIDVIKASTAFEAAKSASDELGIQLAAARKEATEISEAIFKASDVNYSVTQLRERLNAINTRIDDCEMEAKAPVKVTIDQHAANPTRPTRNTTMKVLLSALFAAYGLVLGVFVGFELLDGRIRSRRELEGALGGTSPDPIPAFGSGTEPAFARVVSDNSASPAALALHALAMKIERERKQRGGKVVLVASASAGAGGTSIALNLVDALATMVPRVLFIELPSTKSSRHHLANASTDSLPEALAALERWANCARTETGVVRLAGGQPGKVLPAAVRELLRHSRDIFDLVIVNSASPLLDTLAQFIVLDADAAVVVAREDSTQYADLAATIGILRAAPVPAMTAVLNASSRGVRSADAPPVRRVLARLTDLHGKIETAIRARLAPRTART